MWVLHVATVRNQNVIMSNGNFCRKMETYFIDDVVKRSVLYYLMLSKDDFLYYFAAPLGSISFMDVVPFSFLVQID